MILSDEGGTNELTGPTDLDGTYINSDKELLYVYSNDDGDYPLTTVLSNIQGRYTEELPAWIDHIRFVFHACDKEMLKTLKYVDLKIYPATKKVTQILASRQNKETFYWTYQDLPDLMALLEERLMFQRDRDQNLQG